MFDTLLSTAGLLLVAVLAVAGGLLTWGHNYIGNQVHNQLAAQEVNFPNTTNAEFKALPQKTSPQWASTPARTCAPAAKPNPTPTTTSPST
jgi:hypothetical protein